MADKENLSRRFNTNLETDIKKDYGIIHSAAHISNQCVLVDSKMYNSGITEEAKKSFTDGALHMFSCFIDQ